MKTIWTDITNTPQVHFQMSIYKKLKELNQYKFVFSAREFSETTKLLKSNLDLDFKIIGSHHGRGYVKKIIGLFSRFNQIYKNIGDYDISISHGSENAIWLSQLKGKRSIAFGDNDTARQWTYGHFVDFAFFPNAISRDVLTKQGLSNRKLYLYDGYKEDIYLADYVPDKDFLSKLPFDSYVVVRPENIMANYIRNKGVESITPKLLKSLEAKGVKILYLPRYEIDRNYARDIKNIYIPDKPINGIDACYFSDAVLTGAGTFAREAACLGVPAISFFAGKKLLAVDQKMIKNEKMFFSRQPEEIINYLKKSKKNEPNLERSKVVQNEVIDKLKSILESFN